MLSIACSHIFLAGACGEDTDHRAWCSESPTGLWASSILPRLGLPGPCSSLCFWAGSLGHLGPGLLQPTLPSAAQLPGGSITRRQTLRREIASRGEQHIACRVPPPPDCGHSPPPAMAPASSLYPAAFPGSGSLCIILGLQRGGRSLLGTEGAKQTNMAIGSHRVCPLSP